MKNQKNDPLQMSLKGEYNVWSVLHRMVFIPPKGAWLSVWADIYPKVRQGITQHVQPAVITQLD